MRSDRNIQKFIFFLLSANMGLCVAVFATALIADWSPLTPLMILWINLVTNGLPALALGIDPPAQSQMKERPRRLSDGLLDGGAYWGIAYVGAVMGGLSLLFYARHTEAGNTLDEARALAFSMLALSPLVHAFSCRSAYESLLTMRPVVALPLVVAVAISAAIHFVALLIPPLRPVFKTFALDQRDVIELVLLSAAMVPAMEVWKVVLRGVSTKKAEA